MNHSRTRAIRLLPAALLLVFSPFAFPAGSDEDEEEDERAAPSVRATAIPREAGEWQIMVGTAFEDEDDKRTVEVTVGAEYGVTDRLELSCEMPYIIFRPKGNASDERNLDGPGDFSVGGKFLLWQKGPSYFSASLDITFPTGDDKRSEELGDGFYQFEPMALVDVGLDPIELFVGAGAELNEDRCSFLYEITPTYIIVEDWEISLALEGKVNHAEHELLLVPQFAFPIWEDLEGGLEFPVGLTSDSPNWGVKLEIAWDF